MHFDVGPPVWSGTVHTPPPRLGRGHGDGPGQTMLPPSLPIRLRCRWWATRVMRLSLAVATVAAGLLAVPTSADAGPGTPQTFSDYDADGRTDTAIWRPANGTWWFIDSATGAVRNQQWGTAGDWPVPADYDGDGRTDTAIWRPSTGEWWIVKSSTGGFTRTVWGGATEADDIPVPGDYDGDGHADIAVWRPATGVWWIINSSTGGARTQQWGAPGDWPVPGDYDGDGRTDTAIWRPATGVWWIINSRTGGVRSQQWGDPEDQPVPGDYDGDGRTDTAIWRPATGAWWIINSVDGTVRAQQWGQREDLPVANTQQFVPKLRMQSLTLGAEAVIVDQGSVTRSVPRGPTLRVLVRGNPRVAVSTAVSTTTNCQSFDGSDTGTVSQPLVAPRPGNVVYVTKAPGLCWYTLTVRATWTAGSAAGTVTGTFDYNPVAFDRTFTVPESLYFVDTLIDLEPGDGVVIDGSGSIWSGVIFSGSNGPDGWGPGRFGAGVPAPDAPVYSLVAQVGGTLAGPAFYVGPHFESQTLASGRLFLRINDEAPGNGSGAFTARVEVFRNH